jgi:peptidoglycan hydrolase CwlO-like protein
MTTTNTTNESKLGKQVEKLSNQVDNLLNSNTRLLDDVSALKTNYNKLVEDVSTRFEAIHKKIFR